MRLLSDSGSMYCSTNPIQFCGNFCIIAGETRGDPSLMFLHGLYTRKTLLQTAKEIACYKELGKSLGQCEDDRRQENEGESMLPLALGKC